MIQEDVEQQLNELKKLKKPVKEDLLEDVLEGFKELAKQIESGQKDPDVK
ncbi:MULTISPECIES: hypothetical protein [Persicobacter]|nr:hypothetical protein [Persicobacter sp. CCB-QB2]